MEELDVQKYKGTWYEMLRDKDNTIEEGECVRAIYGDSDSGVSVKNIELQGEYPDQKARVVEGTAK